MHRFAEPIDHSPMEKSTLLRVIVFCNDLLGCDDIVADTDLGKIATGDDFAEMIEKYSRAFDVDLSGYLWYFHHRGEGNGGLGAVFFKTPYKLIERIPITPAMLAEFASLKKWNIRYPSHEVPKKRYDLMINTTVLLLSLVAFILWLVFKYII